LKVTPETTRTELIPFFKHLHCCKLLFVILMMLSNLEIC
jgi:hypothetical protein